MDRGIRVSRLFFFLLFCFCLIFSFPLFFSYCCCKECNVLQHCFFFLFFFVTGWDWIRVFLEGARGEGVFGSHASENR